jgi:hypothetical protein
MNQQAKTKRPFPYVGLILWVTLALVVVILGHTLLDSIGVYGMAKAGESRSIKLNENEVDVYRYHVAQNQLYYQYMYVQYGMMQDPTGGLIKALGWTAADFINYMIPLTIASGDYDALAYEYSEQYLTYCEGAKEVKLYDTYKTEVAADIDKYIEDLKASAKANDMSFNSYLKDFMGNGVSERDIRSAMEYYYIGAKYAEKLTDDFAATVTDADEVKYRDEHKENFYTTDYTAYKLVSNDMKADVENCKTIDDVKTVIVDYYLKQKFEDNYKTNFTDKNVEDAPGKDKTREDVRATLLDLAGVAAFKDKEVFKSTDTDAYKKAAYAIVKAINTSVSTQTAKITETTSNYVNVNPTKADGTPDTEAIEKISDVQKWLFADGRKAGDYKVIETKTTSKDKDGKEVTNYAYTWYIVSEKVMVLDEEHTKNAHYIMLTDDGEDVKENKMTAEQKAKKFHEELSKVTGDKAAKAEKFQELVKQYAPGYSSELVEYISYEDMKATYEDLATWLYDKDRKEGDISNVIVLKNDTTNKDKITGCIVALYMAENEETWKVTATQAIAGEKLTEWYDKAVKDFGVVIDYEFETESETAAQ